MAAEVECGKARLRCAFFVSHKHRLCKMIPSAGCRYCGEHAACEPDTTVGQQRKRIPCPLDPKHSVYADALQKHLKKCNSRERPLPVYYMKNINTEESDDEEDSDNNDTLPLHTEEVAGLIAKIERFSEDLAGEIPHCILLHESLREPLKQAGSGPAWKHLQQQASILGNLEHLALLRPGHCFVEFGAGRGHLAHWVQRALPANKRAHFLLIDRSTARFKVDGKHKQGAGEFERLKIDIQHLDLNFALRCLAEQLPNLTNHVQSDSGIEVPRAEDQDTWTAGVGSQVLRSESQDWSRKGSSVAGLVIALCCHHRCRWRDYVGKEFFRARGLGCKDFSRLCRLSSWATCGWGRGRNGTEGHDPVGETTCPFESQLDLDVNTRVALGQQCKRMLDAGRVDFLRKRGFEATLKVYTDPTVSLENILLTALPRKVYC
uniref:tRNA:m(4)X modification enzyme TRM13 n=1 Tax=Eptatretus burgeri TaxID=7764 RepID=A0A8C4R0Z3_EPTBU